MHAPRAHGAPLSGSGPAHCKTAEASHPRVLGRAWHPLLTQVCALRRCRAVHRVQLVIRIAVIVAECKPVSSSAVRHGARCNHAVAWVLAGFCKNEKHTEKRKWAADVGRSGAKWDESGRETLRVSASGGVRRQCAPHLHSISLYFGRSKIRQNNKKMFHHKIKENELYVSEWDLVPQIWGGRPRFQKCGTTAPDFAEIWGEVGRIWAALALPENTSIYIFDFFVLPPVSKKGYFSMMASRTSAATIPHHLLG